MTNHAVYPKLILLSYWNTPSRGIFCKKPENTFFFEKKKQETFHVWVDTRNIEVRPVFAALQLRRVLRTPNFFKKQRFSALAFAIRQPFSGAVCG